jgi:rare lipoprotein A
MLIPEACLLEPTSTVSSLEVRTLSGQCGRVGVVIVKPMDIKTTISTSTALAAALTLAVSVGGLVAAGPALAASAKDSQDVLSPSHDSRRLSPDAKLALDRSGHKRIGKASFYARMFAGRKMADGTRMQPAGDNAASLTLPLGTTARVTNLETGKTAVVTIRDRGPYVAGRIVDLSPATAREIGLDRHTGVTKVEVAPISVPMPDGQYKLGDGILQANNNTIGADIRTP